MIKALVRYCIESLDAMSWTENEELVEQVFNPLMSML